ncbi:MAG: hypothetical protein AAB839_02495 [Patescibacteria group bacterium]
MPSAIIIHGYATGLGIPLLRKPFGNHAGFVALNEQVTSGEILPFRWSIDRSLSVWQSINPWTYLQLYRDEEKLVEDQKTQSNLANFFHQSPAKIIIAHSLGCRLLLGTINNFELPKHIKRIIFLQADVYDRTVISRDDILVRLEEGSLVIENYHCFWDPSLFTSSMIHRNLRAGLTGWEQPGVQNIFVPLLKPINLHTSHLRDTKFCKNLLT